MTGDMFVLLLVGFGMIALFAFLTAKGFQRRDRSPTTGAILGFVLALVPGGIVVLIVLWIYLFRPRDGWTRPPTRSSYSGGGFYTQEKRCSACGRVVSLSAAAGQRCPHCGALWSYERTVQK